MASRAAQKRLTREYKSISENPPPYITAHPSDSNILEWHYIITGPEDTPYHGGQYWGTLMFPADYPFAPPAIRMHTPSGRFQPSTRLCLSISDFHPRSFNPAWEVSTILIGLLSFMTSEEMTTGSVRATPAERRFYAARSRWWNSTGGGSYGKANVERAQIKVGDGGANFRAEWAELDAANWAWMKEQGVDTATGQITGPPTAGPSSSASSSSPSSSSPSKAQHPSSSTSTTAGSSTPASIAAGAGSPSCGKQLGVPAGTGVGGAGAAGSGTQAQAVVDAVRHGRGAGQGWLSQNKLIVAGGLVFLILRFIVVAMTLGLVVGHSIFNSLSMTMSSDPFVEARRQLTKEQFIDAVMREPVEGIVDLEPIRNKCQKVVQQQGLVWQCDYIQGGLGNLGNTWVNCMYFGIESGATSIILPPVGKRNDKNLIDNGNAKDTTNLPILYDLNHFIETWKQACPHITVYKSPDEVPNLKGNGGRMLTPHQIPGLEVVRQTVFDFHTWRAKFDEWLETNYAADKLQNMSVEKPVHVGAKGLMFAGHRASMDPRFTHAFTRMFASRNSLRRLGAAAVWDLEQRMGRPVVSDAILFPELYAKTYGLPTAAPLQGTTLDKVAVNTSQVTHLLRNRSDATKFKWPGYEFQAPSYLREALERNLTSIYLAAGSAESTQRFKAEAEAADLTTYTKEDVLGEEEMTEYNALTWDNKAVVDFQVLLHSSFFAGYGQSTFSQTMVMRRSALPDAGPNQVNPWRPFTDKSFEIWRDNLSSIYCSLHMQTLDRIWP